VGLSRPARISQSATILAASKTRRRCARPVSRAFKVPPAGEQNDRSSLRQPEGVFGGHGQRRDVVQRGLDRKQGLQARAAMHNSSSFSSVSPVASVNGPDRGAAQGADVGAGAERVGQVADQGADVGPLAAVDLDLDVVGVRLADDLGAVDHHRRAFSSMTDALAGQVVGALAVHLHRREVGRDLVDLADEGRQRRARPPLGVGAHVRGRGDRALAVEAGGLAPQAMVKR
jgi:hypothetical protein